MRRPWDDCAVKRQELSVTKASIAVALAYTVIDVIEEVYDEEVALWEIGVGEAAVNPPQGGEIEVDVYYPGRSGVLGERNIDATGIKVRVVAKDWGTPYYSLPDLYRHLVMLPLRKDHDVIRRLAFETSKTGIEYIVLYTDKGYAAILEGELYMVRIPFVKVAVAYHTHPEGACDLSWKDLESSLDLMVEGGVGEGAATISCAAIVYRVEFLGERDYMLLREAIVKKRPVNPGELETVRLERVTY